jgi:hypothetical protein
MPPFFFLSNGRAFDVSSFVLAPITHVPQTDGNTDCSPHDLQLESLSEGLIYNVFTLPRRSFCLLLRSLVPLPVVLPGPQRLRPLRRIGMACQPLSGTGELLQGPSITLGPFRTLSAVPCNQTPVPILVRQYISSRHSSILISTFP